MNDAAPPCFVIMPYGPRLLADGSFDFDAVFDNLIAPAVRDAGFDPIRSDKMLQGGDIHEDMFTYITNCEVAVVDITGTNPNVMYELGVRHTVRQSTTVIVRRKADNASEAIPFNIVPLRIIEYPANLDGLDEARARITGFIKNGMRLGESDSHIFNIIRDARAAESATVRAAQSYGFRLRNAADREVWILAGDLLNWTGVDVWVNAENTNMQMARYFDRSISATIRYAGAEKPSDGQPIIDTIADELRHAMGGRESVTPGTIMVTGSGALKRSNNVVKIFHAAVADGTPGEGYRVVRNYRSCVRNALFEMDNVRNGDLHSIVFPMLGTGTAGEAIEKVAPTLVEEALTYLSSRPQSRVTKVCFIARSKYDLDVCRNALRNITVLEPIQGTWSSR